LESKPASQGPKRAGKDPQPIGSKDVFVNDPPKHGDKPISTATVYLCRCGETFLVVVSRHKRGSR
jgi:hypothetical protein